MAALIVKAAGHRYGTTSFNVGGSNGYYWSAGPYMASNPNNAYLLNFTSSAFNEGNGNTNRYNGFSVRCVAAFSTLFSLAVWNV